MIDSTANSQQTATDSTLPISRWPSLLFVVAAVSAVTWMMSLLILSVTSANPVTLNRDQIIDSSDVLTALVKDPRSGTIQVERSWKNVVGENELTVSDLASLAVTKEQRFIIPILRNQDAWHVTPSKLPKNPRLIYPASDEAKLQLKSILKTGHLP